MASLKDSSLQIVDARSEGEFCGTDKLKNKRGGAIPGAKHLEWIDLIDKETQRFKTPDQLRKLFADAEISLDRPTATHCQSGGRASVMAFGMELMGAASVANYYASWGEWGNADDTPIVAGKRRRNRRQDAPFQPLQPENAHFLPETRATLPRAVQLSSTPRLGSVRP